jgi:hypothetical protein
MTVYQLGTRHPAEASSPNSQDLQPIHEAVPDASSHALLAGYLLENSSS